MPKLLAERSEAINTQASLLTANAFPERLEQYKTRIAYVEKIWAYAYELYHRGNLPMATFMSIVVIEEGGKLMPLGEELIYFDAPLPIASNPVGEKCNCKAFHDGHVRGTDQCPAGAHPREEYGPLRAS